MIKAILFGIPSLTATLDKPVGPPTYGKQWSITDVAKLPFDTIPLFAVLTYFVLSPDSQFGAVGNKTGFLWEELYNTYRKNFYQCYEDNPHSMSNITELAKLTIFGKWHDNMSIGIDNLSNRSVDIDWKAADIPDQLGNSLFMPDHLLASIHPENITSLAHSTPASLPKEATLLPNPLTKPKKMLQHQNRRQKNWSQ
ncbi:hypothetical protein BDZ94DRAFT_407844 [Collybia nuda]|uniref:Uncharacterized protein n=1 Tax=Collybia nuda TaxID=64659 RepID=A0A9P5YCF6_9AGAR|nr:hypothetical protein BDZ94DRAFT_407844 [Collybia nuda]